ncbi:L-carnitine dehydratase/bile acid-inducible protein F [Nostocoides australiense Ben110]|uniref:L-carnitine dehydratase/bile acid-inducible protein F n=1 Tax=Nostocoides australiense Ben110 TaxID=1193182 RepID=W6K2Z9_9MICO|nr:CoA transferase [Tetrasphaera australiensis]CCH75545.1 L-carnitine dehydratase/bile acid-inducible protein F [Tetrasphaera australiensis Ben110]
MSGPLDGITVIDLSRALAGPQAGMMLGDLGARVIKIESETGDDTRGWGPPFVGPDHDISTYFLAANRNKESIVLDLKSHDGRDILTRLAERADVLVENFRPGVLARLGFSNEHLHELNPRLIVLSISGFGHDGPEGGRAGYDQIAQGEAGLMSVTGSAPDDPQRVGVPIGDLLSGMNGAFGVVAALYERERTGKGRVVRTSLLASVIGAHAMHGTNYLVGGKVGHAQGNHHPSIAPYGLFQADDGPIQIACAAESLWVKFANAFGLDPAAEGMATNRERVHNRDAVVAAVNAALAGHTSEEVLVKLAEIGVPCGHVRTIDQVYTWDQVASQHLLLKVDHPVLGEITIPGSPLRFDDNAYSGGREAHLPPPGLGEHNESIRAWLADSDE